SFHSCATATSRFAFSSPPRFLPRTPTPPAAPGSRCSTSLAATRAAGSERRAGSERAEWEGRHSRTCEARRDADPFERIAVLAMRALRAWQVREHEAARHRTRRVVCAAQEQPMQALRAGTGRVARDPGSRARQTVPTFPSGFGGVPLAYRGPPRVPMSLSRSTIRTELASTLRHLSDTSRRSAVRLIVAEKGTLGQDDILPEPGKGLELVLVAQGANEPASELLARTERRLAALERGDRGVADAVLLVRASADPATRAVRRQVARAVMDRLARSGSKELTVLARRPMQPELCDELLTLAETLIADSKEARVAIRVRFDGAELEHSSGI